MHVSCAIEFNFYILDIRFFKIFIAAKRAIDKSKNIMIPMPALREFFKTTRNTMAQRKSVAISLNILNCPDVNEF